MTMTMSLSFHMIEITSRWPGRKARIIESDEERGNFVSKLQFFKNIKALSNNYFYYSHREMFWPKMFKCALKWFNQYSSSHANCKYMMIWQFPIPISIPISTISNSNQTIDCFIHFVTSIHIRTIIIICLILFPH